MPTRRSLLAGTLMAAPLPRTSQAQTPFGLGHDADQLAITALINSYAMAVDEGRIADVAVLFDKAEFRIEGLVTVTGSEGVAELFSGIILYDDGTPRTRHMVTNLDVAVSETGDTATAQSYLTVLQQAGNAPLQAIFSGIYRDRFSKDRGGWHFRHRMISGVLFGDMSRHLLDPPNQ